MIYNVADTFWGAGLDGKGKNEEGRLLEKIRQRIQQEQ